MVILSFEKEFEQLIKSIETYITGINEPITTIICENKGLTNTDALRLMAAINNNPAVVRTLTHLSFANSNNVFNNDANQISCMLDLTKLIRLEVLRLSNNKLERAPNLSSCQELVELHLDGNQLRVFPNITNCTKLQALNLRRNRIKQMIPWLKCPNLSQLYLGFNSFTSPPNILINPKLQVLELQGNKLSKAGEAALYALMCMKKTKFNLIYDKKCKGRLTRDSLFEHFSSISDFKNFLPKIIPLDAPLFMHFSFLFPKDLPDAKQPSSTISYFRNFIVPALLPLPQEITHIISTFLLPRTILSKNDQLDLITFKSIFRFWKSSDLRDEYNPLERIVTFESEIGKLPEIEKQLQEIAKTSEAMQNLVALNDFVRDNKFNPQCLLLENQKGQTPLSLAVAQNNERVKNRILYMLPAEQKLMTRLKFHGTTLNINQSENVTIATACSIEEDLVACDTNVNLELKHNFATDKSIAGLDFNSFVEELYENSICEKYTLKLNPLQITEKDEPYYEGNVASDGSCLFYSAAFAFLFPAAHDMALFRQRFIKLFGNEVANAAEENRRHFVENNGQEIIQNPEILQILVNHNFRKRVVNFMRGHQERFQRFIPENQSFAVRMQRMENPSRKEWGDQPEIAAISELLNVNIVIYQKQGDILVPMAGAEHNLEDSNTEICLLYTQAAIDTTQNLNNHYNYLLQEQYLPTAKNKLQKDEYDKTAVCKTKTQKSTVELGLYLDNSHTVFNNNNNNNQITTVHENDETIRVSLAPISGEHNYVDPESQSQANLNSEETKTSNGCSLFDSFNQKTIANSFVPINFSGSAQIAEPTINQLQNSGTHTGAKKKINQTYGPTINSSDIHYYFARSCNRLTLATHKATYLITKPLMYAYENSSKVKRGFYQLAYAASRETVVNRLQRVARARCSPDGTFGY